MKKWSKVDVEFFGINFGIKDAEVCTSCGSEYLDQDTLKEIENIVKDKKSSDCSAFPGREPGV